MAICAGSFFSGTTADDTLHRRIRPSTEQEEYLRTQWNLVADSLTEHFKTYNASTWLQGSYKYGTLVRPTKRTEEYDVDLGLYLSPASSIGSDYNSAAKYRLSVNAALATFAKANAEANDIVVSKERCERLTFQKQFHVDVPCYEFNKTSDRRLLATQTNGWESSNPKELYLWFRDLDDTANRATLRRAICYLKVWAGLKFHDVKSKPSSILLTVLGAECFAEMTEKEKSLPEDERFASLVCGINERLDVSHVVMNPVDKNENLNRMDSISFRNFRNEIADLLTSCRKALEIKDHLYAALHWGDIFGHFFPLPAGSSLSLKESTNAPAAIVPDISIEIRAQKSGRYIETFKNSVPMVDKGCNLVFSITNAHAIPTDATVEWTVRNGGFEASDTNDLGHTTSGLRLLGAKEHTRYEGLQYMDCIVKRGTSIISARRVDVHITNRYTNH